MVLKQIHPRVGQHVLTPNDFVLEITTREPGMNTIGMVMWVCDMNKTRYFHFLAHYALLLFTIASIYYCQMCGGGK